MVAHAPFPNWSSARGPRVRTKILQSQHNTANLRIKILDLRCLLRCIAICHLPHTSARAGGGDAFRSCWAAARPPSPSRSCPRAAGRPQRAAPRGPADGVLPDCGTVGSAATGHFSGAALKPCSHPAEAEEAVTLIFPTQGTDCEGHRKSARSKLLPDHALNCQRALFDGSLSATYSLTAGGPRPGEAGCPRAPRPGSARPRQAAAPSPGRSIPPLLESARRLKEGHGGSGNGKPLGPSPKVAGELRLPSPTAKGMLSSGRTGRGGRASKT